MTEKGNKGMQAKSPTKGSLGSHLQAGHRDRPINAGHHIKPRANDDTQRHSQLGKIDIFASKYYPSYYYWNLTSIISIYLFHHIHIHILPIHT